MKAALKRMVDLIDAISEWLGRTVSWLTLAMVLITFMVVVLRYGFDYGRIALQESITYMHALVFMVAAGYTLKHDEHVRVDIFYRGMSPKAKALVDLMGSLLMLIPVCVFIIWISWEYVINAWALLEGSQEAGGLPLVFILKSMIPMLAIVLLLQSVSIIARSLLILTTRPEESIR